MKGIIKAVMWTNGEFYEEKELNVSHHENFAGAVKNLGYELHLTLGDREGFFVEVYRFTDVPEFYKDKSEKKLPKFIASQNDFYDYDVIICKNILELNQYLNSVIPILNFSRSL